MPGKIREERDICRGEVGSKFFYDDNRQPCSLMTANVGNQV